MPIYRSGRSVDLHYARPLLLHEALGYVDGNAVGGGGAAANRILIHNSKGNLWTGPRESVCTHSLSETVHGRRPQEGLLQKAALTASESFPKTITL